MLLEQVFNVSGVPSATFVKPARYEALKVSIRTPGRCAVVEGPSGIGKTSCVNRILDELGMRANSTILSARVAAELEYIVDLPNMRDFGIVIVDDFHVLDDDIKRRIADTMKVLADRGDPDSKLLLIGINKAGDRLVQYGTDVGLRIDIFRMEANPPNKIKELVSLGEAALNIRIRESEAIGEMSEGSFQIAQMLCRELCIADGLTETQPALRYVTADIDVVTDQAMIDLKRIFYKPCVEFARGSKLRREGRAPYLHILKWLRDSTDWSVDLAETIKANPEHRGSVGQVVKKGHLASLLEDKRDVLAAHFFYQPETTIISIEDPRIVFYLRNVNWRSFVREVGYTTDFFQGSYDIALSFAGEDRDVANMIFDGLSEREVSVFYDKDEQHRILAEKVEDYLQPIYRTEAAYVVALLSEHYPNKIWTKFESDQFKSRFGDNAVIPIRFRSARDGFFHEAHEYGSLSFSRERDIPGQVAEIVQTIADRLAEDRVGKDDVEDVAPVAAR